VPTYTGLNALIDRVNNPDLVVLGFPSNNFGLQEPAKNPEILNGVKHVRPGGGFVPKFDLMAKGDVNGENEYPLFTFLKAACPNPVEQIGATKSMYWSPVRQSDLIWNFEKFLIGRDGQPIKRFSPAALPHTMYDDVMKALEA